MSDDIRLNSKRSIVLFIGSVAVCLVMFVCGLWVGRYSFGEVSSSSRMSESTGSPSESLASSGSVGGPTTTPESPAANGATTPTSEPTESFVRAATFTSMAEADTFVASLQVRGFTNAFARETRLPSGESVVHVLLGPYADIERARRVMNELRQNGVSDVQIVPAR
ncbi:MAG TPA: SPOR domain-containing protein [Blastocatellia bacterium]|nr:SPOR domain-containing protein [Blastocatellia bacterium]